MRIATFVCSYNTKEFTKRIYEELKDSKDHDLYILDNSSITSEIPDFGYTIHISGGNVNFGGMIDWVIKSNIIEKYDFIGIFNNDTFGYSSHHIKTLKKHLHDNVGIISFSISKEYDHHANHMWTLPGSIVRESPFIENVSPYFNVNLLRFCRKYCPVDKYGLIDKVFSGISYDLGFKNYIIDEVNFQHLRSGCRKIVGSYNDYMQNHGTSQHKWFTDNPELQKYM